MAADVAQDAGAAPPPSEPHIYRAVRTGERLYQGEIVERIFEWVPSYADGAPSTVSTVSPMPYELAVVFTQDCDLVQDWEKRQADSHFDTDLPCVLLCQAVIAETAFSSESRLRGRDIRKPIQNNKNERYQYLAEVPIDADGAGLGHPALLVDFKSIFTVRTVEVYRQLGLIANTPRRRFRLDTPWTEHLQCRFATYHSRIGLPRDHFVPESRRAEGR